jgi:HSP20 family protein
MATGTNIRSVRETGAKAGGPVTVERAPETRGSWLETTRIPTLLEEMERMMTEFFHRPTFGVSGTPFQGLFGEYGKGGLTPAVDVFEDAGKIVVKADLPGLSKNDIDVKLVENTLEITGEKKTEEKVDQRDFLRLERSYGRFSRAIRLPEGLDTAHVTADFKDGVLEVKIPKIEGKRAVQHINIK